MKKNELSPAWKERRAEAVHDSQVNTTNQEAVDELLALGYTLDEYIDLNMAMYRDGVEAIIAVEYVNIYVGEVKS